MLENQRKPLDFPAMRLEKIEKMQDELIARATGKGGDNETYQRLRTYLLAQPELKSVLPDFIRHHRTVDEFWGFIKPMFSSYQDRRDYIWSEFRPMFEMAERLRSGQPVDRVSIVLRELNAEHVHEVWQRALDRQATDPEGAITVARSTLESVCKLILGEEGVDYADGVELPTLYDETAKLLNLAPSQHTEKVFKQILGGCYSVVNGLAGVRNRLGDAHGKGKAPVRPSPRHAELAVNLAGAMATFLVATYHERKRSK